MTPDLWAFKVASLLATITKQEIRITRLPEGGYRLHWRTTGDELLEQAALPVLSVGTRYGFTSKTKTVWMEVGEYPGRVNQGARGE